MFNFFSKSKLNKKPEYFFGLLLKENEGVGQVLELDPSGKKIKKIDETRFKFTNSWEHIVEDVDEVLYGLEQKNKLSLPKVIFFVYSHLVDQNTKQIKKEYIKRIKNIVDNLGLKALGFIELHEAVSVYLTHKDEAPLTSIIIELDQPLVSIFIYKGGELIHSDSIAKTESLIADLKYVFSKIKGIILPARIILYDSTKLTSESEQIVTHKWDESLFIQIPRVEVLTEEEIQQALMYNFSRQFFEDESILTFDKTPETMGFIVGKDIKAIAVKTEIVESKVTTANFPEEQSGAFKNKRQDEAASNWQSQPRLGEDYSSGDSVVLSNSGVLMWVRSLMVFFIKLSGKMFALRSIKSGGAIFLILGLILIFAALISLLYFFHKAAVTVYFEGKKEKKELQVLGVLGKQDEAALMLRKKDIVIESTDSKETTGKKTIGEKASGQVSIYNKEASEKTFKKGTILTDSQGLKFLLDSEVKVASATESLTAEGNVLTVTGKAKTQAKAFDIGPEGNIKKGEKLSIENASQNLYFAVVESPFLGGSKKDVKTVSKDDIEELKNKLIEKMKKEKNKILAKNDKEARFIEALTEVDIVEEQYSKELGEEGDSLKLTGKGKVTVYTYNDVELRRVVADKLKDSISKDRQLPLSNISYKIDRAEKSNDTVELTVKVEAEVIPKLDENSFRQKIAGKSTSKIKKIVEEEYKAIGYKLSVDTPVPFFKSRLPFFKKNIFLRIESRY